MDLMTIVKRKHIITKNIEKVDGMIMEIIIRVNQGLEELHHMRWQQNL